MEFPLLTLPWWCYGLVALSLTHVTIAAVTIYLHRHQAHRALRLHPVVSHFFRFWLWLTTGMVTREWVAIHRKHHAKCDTPSDPHSPQIYGIHRVLFAGAELYRTEARNRDTLLKYGHGTPDDWIEHALYSRHPTAGIAILLAGEVILFGSLGLTIWALQMLWIPFFAAGVVNGIGHYWGYRSFVTPDASRNILPWGILIGGEELHNNHHAHSSSARLSNRWWEFDLGWAYIRVLEMLHLATVCRVAPVVRFHPEGASCDASTLQAIITHRFEVLARFAGTLRQTILIEARGLRARRVPGLQESAALVALKHWLQSDSGTRLPEEERIALDRAFRSSAVLHTVSEMRDELAGLWGRSAAPREQMVRRLEDWCRRADASGIEALRQFANELRCMASIPASLSGRRRTWNATHMT